MAEIHEADWKLLRKVHPEAVARFCKQVLGEVNRISGDDAKGYHQRYLDIWEVLHRRDNEMSAAFDDLRRSRAIDRIASMQSLGVLTEEEFSRFSQETRERVNLINKM